MISAVLIDDEQDCIDDLLLLIKKQKLPIQILAIAKSGSDGITAILKHKPNLVFLDVLMPGMNGFEMLELLPEVNFKLIISTSMDKFAIQALRASALDFLLKPVKASELYAAVHRAIEDRSTTSKSQISLLNENLNTTNHHIKKIALSISDGIQLVNLSDVIYFESDSNYTYVHVRDAKPILVSKSIVRFEEVVDPQMFFRVHNSYLVNLSYVNKVLRSDGGSVILENGKSLPVARSRKAALLEFLGKI